MRTGLKVKVEAPGFQTMVRSNIELQVQQAARIDFTLTVGQTTQAIEVSGAVQAVGWYQKR